MAPVHDPDRVLAALYDAHGLAAVVRGQSVHSYVTAWQVGLSYDPFGSPRLAQALASLVRTGHAHSSYGGRDGRLAYRITEAGWRHLCQLAGVQP